MIAASGYVLDLTRSVSRIGRGPLTGIDRVELAYLRYLLARPEPLFGLVRTALGFVLLDRAGARGVMDRLLGHVPLGRVDLLGLLTKRHLPQRAAAEADARRLGVARCLPAGLAAMLRKTLPSGAAYVNVGHANLHARVFQAVKPRARVIVLLHDTIPLDHPQFCRADVTAAFVQKLGAVARHADLVVHPAKVTRAQTEAHFAKAGRVPDGIAVPLGVEMAASIARPDVTQPYFVALGTIEPRKNMGLLAETWRTMQKSGDAVPQLYIIGNRGWERPEVFAELAALDAVTLLHDCADAEVMALLAGARALLFPSHAEGYGLPPVEAAALAVPVLATNLPVVVETLGDYPVYLDGGDVYAWAKAIKQLTAHPMPRQTRVPPGWADHFDRVFGKD